MSFFSYYIARFRRFDWVLMGAVALLGAAGLTTLASINPDLFRKQVVWYALFFVVVFVGSQVDWRWLLGQAWFRHGVYWLSVGLLIFTRLQSGTIRGTKSWIAIGGFQFEPSEFAKFALIVFLAGFFSRRGAQVWLGKNIALSLFYALLPTALVIMQPDLGSALVLLAVWMGFLLMNGLHVRRLLLLAGGFLLVAAASWFLLLEPYQKSRITSFVFPDRDPQGASYNVIQSKVAIGSAGWFGKGFGLGTQTHLRFLPEPETDFIFAALVEEWGVLAGGVVLLLFVLILFRITRIGVHARNSDYQLVSLGVVVVLLVHFLVNIGSTLGLTPVTGISLPFVSYGGSHLLTLSLLVAIMQRIKLESVF